jgi:hypothetical protein
MEDFFGMVGRVVVRRGMAPGRSAVPRLDQQREGDGDQPGVDGAGHGKSE